MRFSKLDLFEKLDNNHRTGTTTGGILSLITIGLIISLFVIEIKSFLNPPLRQRLSVVNKRPTEADGVTITKESQEKTKVNFDIFFPNAPCYLLHFDLIDAVSQLDLFTYNQNITYTRFSSDGKVIGDFDHSARFNTSKVTECGFCNATKGLKDKYKCCNTCQQVLEVAQVFRVVDIPQCSDKVKELKKMQNEGCRIKGNFETIKIKAEFHISPGYSVIDEDGVHAHDVSSFIDDVSELNLSYKLNHCRFGDQNHSQLDGFSTIQKQIGYFYAVYTIDVSENNDYSTAYMEQVDNGTLVPGIVFKYDFGIITAKSFPDRPPLIHLFSNLVSMAGGVAMIFYILDYALFSSIKQRKIHKNSKLTPI